MHGSIAFIETNWRIPFLGKTFLWIWLLGSLHARATPQRVYSIGVNFNKCENNSAQSFRLAWLLFGAHSSLCLFLLLCFVAAVSFSFCFIYLPKSIARNRLFRITWKPLMPSMSAAVSIRRWELNWIWIWIHVNWINVLLCYTWLCYLQCDSVLILMSYF